MAEKQVRQVIFYHSRHKRNGKNNPNQAVD